MLSRPCLAPALPSPECLTHCAFDAAVRRYSPDLYGALLRAGHGDARNVADTLHHVFKSVWEQRRFWPRDHAWLALYRMACLHMGQDDVFLGAEREGSYCSESMAGGRADLIPEELLHRLLAIPEMCYRDAVRKFGGPLRRYLLSLASGNEEDADDWLQRTFFVFWKKRERFDARNEWGLLKSIGARVVWSSRRSWAIRDKYQQGMALDWWVNQYPDDPEIFLSEEALRRCWARLKPVDQEILELYYYYGCGDREISEISRGQSALPEGFKSGPGGFFRAPRDNPEQEDRLDSWQGRDDAVRRRRNRAFDQLARCVMRADGERANLRLVHTKGTERGQQFSPFRTARGEEKALLDMVCQPECLSDIGLETLRARMADSPSLRRFLTYLLAVEQHLVVSGRPLFEAAPGNRDPDPDPSLPEWLESALLNIPSAEDDWSPVERPRGDPKEQRDAGDDVSSIGSLAFEPCAGTEGKWAREGFLRRRLARVVGSVAAVLFVSVGAWHVQRPSPEEMPDERAEEAPVVGGVRSNRPSFPAPVAERGSGEFSGDRNDLSAPLILMVQDPVEPYGGVVELSVISPAIWRASVYTDKWIQLRVSRPDVVPAESSWQAEASLWRLSKKSGKETSLDISLQSSGASTVRDIALGKAIDLSRLDALGFVPGDALVFEVLRGADAFRLEVVLMPPSPRE